MMWEETVFHMAIIWLLIAALWHDNGHCWQTPVQSAAANLGKLTYSRDFLMQLVACRQRQRTRFSKTYPRSYIAGINKSE